MFTVKCYKMSHLRLNISNEMTVSTHIHGFSFAQNVSVFRKRKFDAKYLVKLSSVSLTLPVKVRQSSTLRLVVTQ